MLLLYTPELSPRLEYVADLLFRQLMGMDYIITTELTELRISGGPRINYSTQPLDGCFNIWAEGLIHREGIEPLEPSAGRWGKSPILFTAPEGYSLPFDLFSAVFYLVTRYEEYLPGKRDQFGRFQAEDSILWKMKVLEKPVVNNWAVRLRKILQKGFPETPVRKKHFSYLSTIDIDMVFKYRFKGFMRNAGGFMRDMLKLKVSRALDRGSVLLGEIKDPFDNFSYQFSRHKKYGINAIHFFQVGKRGRYDKNISIKQEVFREIIRKTEKQNPVGIHPSFRSNRSFERLQAEVKALAEVTGKPPYRSRQHFLVMTMPETYRRLIALDIHEDYTMGYSTHAGFRAGICSPFLFFDLERNETTTLMVFPFAVMDVTLQRFYGLSPKNAIKKIQRLMKRVYKVRGTFISVWHNESLSGKEQWKGWKTVYEKMLAEASLYQDKKGRSTKQQQETI